MKLFNRNPKKKIQKERVRQVYQEAWAAKIISEVDTVNRVAKLLNKYDPKESPFDHIIIYYARCTGSLFQIDGKYGSKVALLKDNVAVITLFGGSLGDSNIKDFLEMQSMDNYKYVQEQGGSLDLYGIKEQEVNWKLMIDDIVFRRSIPKNMYHKQIKACKAENKDGASEDNSHEQSVEQSINAIKEGIRNYIAFVRGEQQRLGKVRRTLRFHRHGQDGIDRAIALLREIEMLEESGIQKDLESCVLTAVSGARKSGRNHPNSLNSFLAEYDNSVSADKKAQIQKGLKIVTVN